MNVHRLSRAFLLALVFACTAIGLPSTLWGQGLVGDWAAIFNDNFVPQTIKLHIRAQGQGYELTFDNPILNVKNGKVTDFTIKGDSIRLNYPDWEFTFEGALRNGRIEGTATVRDEVSPLTFYHKPIVARSLQGIAEEEVTIQSGAHKLYGTWARPKDAKRARNVLLIQVVDRGSINRDGKDEVLDQMKYRDLSDSLVRLGYDVLRYDKRGVGKSEGELPSTSMQEQVEDLVAVLRFAQSKRPKQRRAFVGHGEGAVLSAMAVSRGADVEALYMLAPPSLPMLELTHRQQAKRLNQMKEHIQPMMTTLSEIKPEVLPVMNSLFDKAMAIYGGVANVVADESLPYSQVPQAIDDYMKQALQRAKEDLPQGSAEMEGMQEAILDGLIKDSRSQLILKTFDSPYAVSRLRLRPMELFAQLRLPIYILSMEFDAELDADNLTALQQGLPKADLRVVAGCNQIMQSVRDTKPTNDLTSLFSYYINPDGIAPALMSALSDQLARQFGSRK